VTTYDPRFHCTGAKSGKAGIINSALSHANEAGCSLPDRLTITAPSPACAHARLLRGAGEGWSAACYSVEVRQAEGQACPNQRSELGVFGVSPMHWFPCKPLCLGSRRERARSRMTSTAEGAVPTPLYIKGLPSACRNIGNWHARSCFRSSRLAFMYRSPQPLQNP